MRTTFTATRSTARDEQSSVREMRSLRATGWSRREMATGRSTGSGSVSVEYSIVCAGVFLVIVASVSATGLATLEFLRDTCSAVSRAVGGPSC